MEIENPGNLGAICRVMSNFGFKNLVLVNPKCDIHSSETIKRAKHANDVLRNIKIVDSLDNYDYIIATTAKLGNDYNIPRSPISPEELSKQLQTIDSSNIALLIGREGDGLTNDEIKKADFLVTIPAAKEYFTLNISHAVGIILYELSKTKLSTPHTAHIIPASKKDKEVVMQNIKSILDNMKFSTEDKKETQRLVWKKILGKSFLTKREAFALIGFLKKL